ncbi:MAG: class I SAM-dependent methyltransferase [Candidatus Nomurabacteria bacterium]|nr:MAG: class I SAM-dependent methyltransferase [Candidatus Nomurabacteria bacterium]
MMDLDILKKRADDRWFVVDRSKGKRVLEIGCVNHTIEGIEEQRRIGTWLFDYLHVYGTHATGIDIDQPAIDHLAKQGYDIRYGDGQDFNLNEEFEVIIASKVIDHLTNIDGFLKSCKKHLSPDGKLIITDDNILCVPQLLTWYAKKNVGHPDDDITVKIIPEYFRLFVRRYGFEVEEIHYVVGTGNSFLFKLFRFIKKIMPKRLVHEPLFYPNYIIQLRHRTNEESEKGATAHHSHQH